MTITIDEAIKELEALKILEGAKFMPYTCDALQLGIKALKEGLAQRDADLKWFVEWIEETFAGEITKDQMVATNTWQQISGKSLLKSEENRQ